MMRDLRIQFVKLDHRQRIYDLARSGHVTVRKLCPNLLLNSSNESRLTLKIKRHDYHPTKQTSKEGCHPLGTVPGPEQNAIVFCDPSRFQFPRKPQRGPPNL